MSVKVDASGRRSVQVEVEVPGTPEEVWKAIATGPGVSSWFVPTDIEEGADGTPARVVCHFGPGMDSDAKVTAWEPPHRFAAESRGGGPGGPAAPPIATEWIVEARAGGTCIVRVVHSLFASGDDWDDQLTSVESGWPAFFRILRVYLTHFRGQRSASFLVMGSAALSASAAFDALIGGLGFTGAAIGARAQTGAGAPPLAGVVDSTGDGNQAHVLVVLDEPAPGVAFLNAVGMGSQSMLAMCVYFYGDRAADVVARDEPLWRAWMKEHFPAAGPSPCG